MGEAIDLAGHALGGLEQRFDGGGLEQGQLAASQAQAVAEVLGQLLAGQPAQMMAHHDALGERFVHRHAQAATQLGESDQQQTQAVFRIHLIVGEQTQILEHLVAQMMGLIDDEDRALLGLQAQAGDLGADGAEGGGAVALHRQSQLPTDALVHVHHVAGRERDVEHPIQSRMQIGGDLAADGGFPRAGLAGDQTDGAQLQQMFQTRRGLAETGGGEQGIRWRGQVEGEGG